jgi:hypothetical protein
MLVMSNSYEFALLGQPIFQGYYTHHHMENDFIAFGPLTVDGAYPLELGTKPTQPLPGIEGATIIQLAGAIFYIVICMIFF